MTTFCAKCGKPILESDAAVWASPNITRIVHAKCASPPVLQTSHAIIPQHPPTPGITMAPHTNTPKPIDPNDAPPGYVAMDPDSTPDKLACAHCALKSACDSASRPPHPCMPRDRMDGRSVYFTKAYSSPQKPAESDPTGTLPHTPGAKLDAGKAPMLRGALSYFPRALRAVAQVSAHGASKYTWNGWESVPDGAARYGDALVRHLAAEATGQSVDADSGLAHAAHAAWNALARLELIMREQEKKS